MDRYELGDRIGKGTYGTVFRARDKQGTDHVAVKTIDLEDEEGIPSTAIREISLLKFLKHPNIVNLHDVIHIYNKLYMVFELLELDLKHYIEVCPNGLQVITIKSLLYQLLQGLAYCHKQRVLHRDLKPANLLLNRAGILKIGDFGLARSFAMPISLLKHEVITLWYRAPELLLGSTIYSTEVDMWSVGCIFAEMLTSQPLFNGSTDDAQIDLIFKACGNIAITASDLDEACEKVRAIPHPSANPDAPANLMFQTGQEIPPDHPNPSPDLGAYIASLPLYNKYAASVSAPGTAYHPTNVLSLVPHIAAKDPNCQDLLCKLLDLDPRRRISAEAAMQHPFFSELKHKQRRSSQHAHQVQAPPQQQQPPPQQQQPPQQQPPQQQQIQPNDQYMQPNQFNPQQVQANDYMQHPSFNQQQQQQQPPYHQMVQQQHQHQLQQQQQAMQQLQQPQQQQQWSQYPATYQQQPHQAYPHPHPHQHQHPQQQFNQQQYPPQQMHQMQQYQHQQFYAQGPQGFHQ